MLQNIQLDALHTLLKTPGFKEAALREQVRRDAAKVTPPKMKPIQPLLTLSALQALMRPVDCEDA